MERRAENAHLPAVSEDFIARLLDAVTAIEDFLVDFLGCWGGLSFFFFFFLWRTVLSELVSAPATTVF